MKPVERDAREFGVHLRGGGWRLALLVARSVEVDRGRGGPQRRPASMENGATAPFSIDGKLSARDFAKAAGTDHARVMRYLESWEAAADAGLVPHAAELVPGQEVELPEADRWSQFYPPYPAVAMRDLKRREALEAQAAEDGLSAAQVIRTATNPKAIAAAIKADPEVAQAAESALRQRHQRDQDGNPPYPNYVPPPNLVDVARIRTFGPAPEELVGPAPEELDAAYERVPEALRNESLGPPTGVILRLGTISNELGVIHNMLSNPRIEWGSMRNSVAEELMQISTQAHLLAELAMDPGRATVTDEELERFLGGTS